MFPFACCWSVRLPAFWVCPCVFFHRMYGDGTNDKMHVVCDDMCVDVAVFVYGRLFVVLVFLCVHVCVCVCV